MTQEEAGLGRAVEQAVRRVFKEDGFCSCASLYGIAPLEHAKHHQLLKEAFNLRRQVMSTVVKVVVGSGLFWLGLAIWERFMREVSQK